PAAGLVDAVRDAPYLEVVSSLNDDGSTLYVMAINTHFDRPIDTTIAIEGFAPATLRTWTLTGSGIDAHTGTELPKTPGLNWAAQTAAQPGGRFDHGGPDEVRIDAADAAPATANVEYRFG